MAEHARQVAEHMRQAAPLGSAQQGQVPPEIEALIECDGLPDGLANWFRRLYLASQARRQEMLRQSGCRTWDEYNAIAARERIRDAIADMGAPGILRDAAFESRGTRWNQAVKAAFDWVDGKWRGSCLVLSGPTGVGKSFSAVCAARVMIAEGASVTWVYAGDHLADLAPWQIRGSTAATCEAMVLDDLGAEARREAEKLDTLMYYRHGNRRTTIVTTNLSLDGITERYGRRFADRLLDWATVVELNAQSMRGGA